MKKIKYTLIALSITINLVAQELNVNFDSPGDWHILWNMEQDNLGNLYASSENGVLYIKRDGIWEAYNLNPDGSSAARGIAIDQDSIVWVGSDDGLYYIENEEINLLTTANSGLPSNYLKEVRAYQDSLWIVSGSSLILKVGSNYTHYTSSNSPLANSSIADIGIKDDGTVIVVSYSKVHFISDEWTTYDFLTLFGCDQLGDIYIDHNQDIWFTSRYGIIKHNNDTGEFEDLKSVYGEERYSAIINTPNNEVWIDEKFMGLHYFSSYGNHFYFENTPSQIFGFTYYQDTVRAIGTGWGGSVGTLSIDFFDNDGDDFNADEDCDDNNPDINPDAEEIPNNDIDEDCDGEALVIDVDEDGFNSDEDCDDSNPDINPDVEEIPNNDIDEDCDGEALVIDVDEDGFNSDEDCDDDNPDINPDAEEIPNNDIDEDCDGEDLVLDVFQLEKIDISIHPNPFNESIHLNIKSNNIYSYAVANVSGVEITKGLLHKNNTTINTTKFNSGFYLLYLKNLSSNETIVYKLVK